MINRTAWRFYFPSYVLSPDLCTGWWSDSDPFSQWPWKMTDWLTLCHHCVIRMAVVAAVECSKHKAEPSISPGTRLVPLCPEMISNTTGLFLQSLKLTDACQECFQPVLMYTPRTINTVMDRKSVRKRSDNLNNIFPIRFFMFPSRCKLRLFPRRHSARKQM